MPSMPDHQHGPLRGNLPTGRLRGRQVEVTGAVSGWYLIDDDRRIVRLVHAEPGHRKATG